MDKDFVNKRLERFGVMYNGVQRKWDGAFAFHLFTDLVTGGTFSCQRATDMPWRLRENRLAFAEEG